MDITSLRIEAVSGAIGGNVAGAAMKENSLGTVGNSIAGILGGGLGRDGPPFSHGIRGGGRRWDGSSKYSCQRRWWQGWRRDSHGHRRHPQEQDGPEIAGLTTPSRRLEQDSFVNFAQQVARACSP